MGYRITSNRAECNCDYLGGDKGKIMILVMGVGRSGTTTVARILQTEFNICMGHNKKMGIPENGHPKGQYDDLEMFSITKKLIQGLATGKEWRRQFYDQHQYECSKSKIGSKVTYLSEITPEQLIEINPTMIIRTHRIRDLTVNSLHKYRGFTKEHWEKFYDRREISMNRLEAETHFPFFRISFTERELSDKELFLELLAIIAVEYNEY